MLRNWSQIVPLVALFVSTVFSAEPQPTCPTDKLQGCLSMAYKFLQDDHFTFPTTKGDLEDVCNSWSKFLECIESYVADCLDSRQKSEFKQAVGSILESVRNLCTDANYQQDYFKHADCIKSTCTDDAYCGRYYKQLIKQVSQDFNTNDLCCTYHQFDTCVVKNTNSICGSTARDFATAMLNKAMSFLASRCQVASQSLEECSGDSSVASVTNAPIQLAAAGSRALAYGPSTTTTRWSPTKEPQSLAYENDDSHVIRSSASIVTIFTFISIIIKLF